MTDILFDDIITCRKARCCDQCGRTIAVGQKYRKQVYKDGDLVTYSAHEDCDQAYTQMKEYAGSAWRPDDLFFPLGEIACERDDAWIKEQFPAVAERLWPTVR
jgi:hypothetical protein